MIINNCMKKQVFSIHPETKIEEAVVTFVKHHIGTLPVVDAQKRLVGILQIRDLVSLALPDFVNMLQNIDYVVDFGAAETRKPDEEMLKKPVSELMQPPVFAAHDCSLLRAAALIKKHNLLDLPVVDEENHLIGIASWVDIGTSFLKYWNNSNKD